ncbi:MAG: hypothetical protein LBQ22_06710 [Bacteroidales bacterium]|nr:hypothetical protein [Bacteroidales bacterium]
MIKYFIWTKRLFSNTYNIYSNGKTIGYLKNKAFSQLVNGRFNDKEYTFRTKGFFKQYTEIIDNTDSSLTGKITYNSWMTRAMLSVNSKILNWKYDNLWNTKWYLSDQDRILINYYDSTTSGQINSDTDDSLLILSGLFIANYYKQMTAVSIMTLIVPVLAVTTVILR